MKRLIQVAAALVLGLAVFACTGNDSAKRTADTELPRTVIKTSQVRAGGAIAVNTRVLTDVMVGEAVTVELTIVARPYRDLWLTIADDEHFALQGEAQRLLEGSDSRTLTERMTLKPLAAGKHYLRMTLFYKNGGNPRSVVVALKVKDSSGKFPKADKPIKNRIEFQSLPAR